MPPYIKRLNRTAQLILALLVAIAIAEYAIMYTHYNQTKENFRLIEQTYLRTSALFRVTFNTRSLALINEGILTNYMGHSNKSAFVSYLQKDLTQSLNEIYDIQNEINLSQLPLNYDLDQMLNNKTTTLYFKQDSNAMKALDFSLTESILQMSSTIFTLSNLPIQSFNETNEDVFFLLYNSFHGFLLNLYQTS